MRTLPLLAFFLAGTVAAQTEAPSLQNLITNSPFGSAAQANTPAADSPLEFRGTFVDGGERFFSILDTGSRRAEWVSLNETGRPFAVKSYDPEHDAIVVEHQGRSLDLKLHSARVAALPPPVANPGNGQADNAGRTRVGPSPGSTEAQRLAQVAEEIRRRRALRQQAQQQAAPQNSPNSSNQPRPR